jgi:hypothetical protein
MLGGSCGSRTALGPTPEGQPGEAAPSKTVGTKRPGPQDGAKEGGATHRAEEEGEEREEERGGGSSTGSTAYSFCISLCLPLHNPLHTERPSYWAARHSRTSARGSGTSKLLRNLHGMELLIGPCACRRRFRISSLALWSSRSPRSVLIRTAASRPQEDGRRFKREPALCGTPTRGPLSRRCFRWSNSVKEGRMPHLLQGHPPALRPRRPWSGHRAP